MEFDYNFDIASCCDEQRLAEYHAELNVERTHLSLTPQEDITGLFKHLSYISARITLRLVQLKGLQSNGWTPYSVIATEKFIGIPLLGYSPEWVCEDFNPRGVREIVPTDEGIYCARWNGSHDCWITDYACEPTHFMEQPKPPKQ